MIFPFFIDTKSRKILPIWILILATIPIGIDGITQLLGWRECTNDIRIITG
ncbi:MAG: DUF2085 domain-containing protein, partial [Candidatus Woesearchaeota archaeon]